MPLILIEGTPGSGKSTTTKKLSEFLCAKNIKNTAFLEFNEDHPIGPAYNKDSASDIILSTRSGTYPYHYWKSLMVSPDEFVIFEAKFLQMSGFFCMLAGGDEKEIFEIPQRILTMIPQEIPVKLIYLSQSEPRKHIQEIVAQRKTSNKRWFPWIIQMFSSFPWVKQRGLSGDEIYVQAVSEWSHIQRKLVSSLEVEMIQIEDPFLNWDRSLDRIFNWVTS